MTTVLVALVLPGSALAAGKSRSATFTLPASNGYELEFRANRTVHGTEAWITVTRGDGAASYHVTPELITSHRIEADFGPYGNVSIRYHATGPEEGGPCNEDRPAAFRGTIGFEGEGRFTSVRARSAQGVVRPLGGGVCVPGLTTRSEAPIPRIVALFSCNPSLGYGYAAIDGLSRRPFHLAVQIARIGRVDVTRQYFREGSLESFAFRKDGSAASVLPPGQFSGSGSFADGRLSGDLSILLPGLEIPLALVPAEAGFGRPPRACNSRFFGGPLTLRRP